MRISEMFYSIQGEGLLAGVPSSFVRTTGCNLRCHFCDTPYTSWQPEGTDWTPSAIVEHLSHWPSRHVVVTGGEPLLSPELPDLLRIFDAQGWHITVETAGTVYKEIPCDLISLSPKLASSTPWTQEGGKFALMHESARWKPEIVRAFMDDHDYQLKFVMDRPSDFSEVQAMLQVLDEVEPHRVLLMPQGQSPQEIASRSGWISELCKEHGYRYCARLHIDLYGGKRGT